MLTAYARLIVLLCNSTTGTALPTHLTNTQPRPTPTRECRAVVCLFGNLAMLLSVQLDSGHFEVSTINLNPGDVFYFNGAAGLDLRHAPRCVPHTTHRTHNPTTLA